MEDSESIESEQHGLPGGIPVVFRALRDPGRKSDVHSQARQTLPEGMPFTLLSRKIA